MKNFKSNIPKEDLAMKQGDTFSTTFEFTEEGGTPLDLDGYEFFMQARFTPRGDKHLDISSTTGEISYQGGGVVIVSIPHTTTTNIGRGKYVYDLEARKGAVVRTLVSGIIWVEADITYE